MRLKRLGSLGMLTLAAFAGGAVFGQSSLATSRDESPYAILEKFGRVLLLVENAYVEPVDREKALEGAIKGMVAELDPHSSYMSKEEYAAFRSDTSGELSGIGIEVDLRDERVTVLAPIEGSPAAKAGLRPGDRIVAIDGQPTRKLPLDELVRRMRGLPGTRVVLSIRREGVEKTLTVPIVRQKFHVASVAGKWLDGDIAYLRIKQFQRGTHKELLRHFGELRKASSRLEGVVLDLRNNPGGLVEEAVGVADELLASGGIYSSRHRGQVVDEVWAEPGGALVRPRLVVLVNEYTASAAELIAGAIQDARRGTVLGARTFGKGSVQTVLDLPGGAGMKLTTMRYYTPSGASIQAKGIVPDIVVEMTRGPDEATPTVREQDLRGHLSPEGKKDEEPSTTKVVRASPPAESWRLASVSEIPTDPSEGDDPVLALGYRILRDAAR